MTPALPVGTTAKVVTAVPTPGDVFVFRRRNGQLVTHRLVARIWLPALLGGSRWVQTGDARPSLSAIVRETQLVGRVESPTRPFRRSIALRLAVRAVLRALRPRMV